MSKHQIGNVQELTELIGDPIDFVKDKVEQRLTEEMIEFISTSSLILLSTIDAQGNPDISPKGDPAGFVFVENATTLHIPERPGNKLMYGFHNILNDPSVGVLFITPNSRETLRIKGKASLHHDPVLLEQLSVRGKPALLSTQIQVEECFFHCGKAMIRSGLWDPASWDEPGKSLMLAQASKKLDADEELEKMIETEMEKNYIEELY